MVQSIFEEMGGRYERQGEYILPCLTIPPEKEQSIDLFGRRHLDYLREYRKITYTNLLTSGRLNAYLADIDRQAQEHFERLIEGMNEKGVDKATGKVLIEVSPDFYRPTDVVFTERSLLYAA